MHIILKPLGHSTIPLDTESDDVASGTSIASETWIDRYDTLTLDEAAVHLTQEVAAAFEAEGPAEAAGFAYGVIRHLLDLADKPASVREVKTSELPR